MGLGPAGATGPPPTMPRTPVVARQFLPGRAPRVMAGLATCRCHFHRPRGAGRALAGWLRPRDPEGHLRPGSSRVGADL